MVLDEPRYSNRYESHQEHFTVLVEDSDLTVSTFHGQGSMAGARAYIQMLNEVVQFFPEDGQRPSLVDLSHFHGTPLRAQLSLGRWMLQHKHQLDKVAVVGARVWERKIAKAIMKISRFNRLEFFADQASARAWLGV